jgi:hypothetical protein
MMMNKGKQFILKQVIINIGIVFCQEEIQKGMKNIN